MEITEETHQKLRRLIERAKAEKADSLLFSLPKGLKEFSSEHVEAFLNALSLVHGWKSSIKDGYHEDIYSLLQYVLTDENAWPRHISFPLRDKEGFFVLRGGEGYSLSAKGSFAGNISGIPYAGIIHFTSQIEGDEWKRELVAPLQEREKLGLLLKKDYYTSGEEEEGKESNILLSRSLGRLNVIVHRYSDEGVESEEQKRIEKQVKEMKGMLKGIMDKLGIEEVLLNHNNGVENYPRWAWQAISIGGQELEYSDRTYVGRETTVHMLLKKGRKLNQRNLELAYMLKELMEALHRGKKTEEVRRRLEEFRKKLEGKG